LGLLHLPDRAIQQYRSPPLTAILGLREEEAQSYPSTKRVVRVVVAMKSSDRHARIIYFNMHSSGLPFKRVNRAILVFSGSWIGKTRVATLRIADMIQEGTPPSENLGLTFTNKASLEMRRTGALFGPTRMFSFAHSHSFGARILRESIHPLWAIRAALRFTMKDDLDKY